MIINILCAESLGARGLSCSIQLKRRNILIDPGIALGWSRHGLLPHPFQVAVGAGVRQTIIDELHQATDIVFSHYHGDHCPLHDANPYQLGLDQARDSLSRCRILARGPGNASPAQQRRRLELTRAAQTNWQDAEGSVQGPLEFSVPVPHGQKGDERGMVMMTKIAEDGTVFVHASDIQLLDRTAIEIISGWKPDIVLASGPALYHYSSPSGDVLRERAWENALELSQNTGTLIIDHHLLRSGEGVAWLDKLNHASENPVMCAADFMKREPLFLEAWRKELYEWMPVPGSWHDRYRRGTVDTGPYRAKRWKELASRGMIRPCTWYACCPIRYYTDAGKLDPCWTERYCLVNNRQCVRYRMEENGQYHPDNMLPNGEIKENLS